MKKEIKVKCVMGYELNRNNEEKNLLAVVEQGKEYIAFLTDFSEEYLAKDDEGREFLVGTLEWEELILEEEFELIN